MRALYASLIAATLVSMLVSAVAVVTVHKLVDQIEQDAQRIRKQADKCSEVQLEFK